MAKRNMVKRPDDDEGGEPSSSNKYINKNKKYKFMP